MKRLVAGACLLLLSIGTAMADGFDFDPYISLWTGDGHIQDVAVGDINGDRLDDVVIGIGSSGTPNDFSLQVFLQRADGTLAPPKSYPYGDRTSAGVVQVALADLNSDGVSDIVACEKGLTLYLSNGRGGFSRSDLAPVAPTTECDQVAFLDVDRDSHLDIVAQSMDHGTGIYYGNGNGGVRSTGHLDSVQGGGITIDVGDLTGDGIADLVVVAGSPHIYPVNQGGGFGAEITLPAPDTGGWNIEDVAVGDYNQDGREDIAVGLPSNQPDAAVWVYSQDSTGTFGAPVRLGSYDIPTSLVAADLDHDGRDDLLLGHRGWAAIGRYLQGDMGLTAEATTPVAFQQWRKGLAIGDINDDGCTDAVVAPSYPGASALHGHGCRAVRVRNDFDGDGRSDLLWRNKLNGANVIWRMASSKLPRSVKGVSSQAWQVAGTGDFDGDGRSDILWHNAGTGASVIWKAGVSTATKPVATVTDTRWEIVGVGDFSGDGMDDILWRNRSTGHNSIWRSGDYRFQLAVTSVSNPYWKVAGVDDFNGDGRDDILWRSNATGADSIWLSASSSHQKPMNDVTDLTWKIVGTGDFDGDGQADVLWRRSNTGSNSIWRSAEAAKGIKISAVTDMHWMVATVGDYNGNRKADIAWRNTVTGENVIWRSAIRAVQWPTTGMTNLAWHIAP